MHLVHVPPLGHALQSIAQVRPIGHLIDDDPKLAADRVAHLLGQQVQRRRDRMPRAQPPHESIERDRKLLFHLLAPTLAHSAEHHDRQKHAQRNRKGPRHHDHARRHAISRRQRADHHDQEQHPRAYAHERQHDARRHAQPRAMQRPHHAQSHPPKDAVMVEVQAVVIAPQLGQDRATLEPRRDHLQPLVDDPLSPCARPQPAMETLNRQDHRREQQDQNKGADVKRIDHCTTASGRKRSAGR